MSYIAIVERNENTDLDVGNCRLINGLAYDLRNGSPMLQLYRKPELGGSIGARLGVHWVSLEAWEPKSRGSTA